MNSLLPEPKQSTIIRKWKTRHHIISLIEKDGAYFLNDGNGECRITATDDIGKIIFHINSRINKIYGDVDWNKGQKYETYGLLNTPLYISIGNKILGGY